MKFNAYIVELKHRENSFTDSLIAADSTVSANFKKIGNDPGGIQVPGKSDI